MSTRLKVSECRDFIKAQFRDGSYIKDTVHARTENDAEHERVIITAKLNGWAYLMGNTIKTIEKKTDMHLNYHAHYGIIVEMLFVRDRK